MPMMERLRGDIMRDSQPNILLLFTDMQRHDTIAALGNPHIKTPNLDRLVREGTAFTHAYTPSPVCVPARCCMHYGKYADTLGCAENGSMPADDGTSYVSRLGEAGYRTHAIGKLHFTPDWSALRGLQSRETQEEMPGHPSQDDYQRWLHGHGYDWILDPHGVRGEMYYIPQVANMPQALHPTQWIGDRSIAFLEDPARNEQPWYLMASFIHPHPPLNPPNPWHKLYRGPDMPLPMVPQDREVHLTWINAHQNRYKYRDQGIDNHLLRQIKAHYYACISFVDFQVGRILAALEASGQLDQTLIIFTSDHGEHLGDYHCFGKRSMHDSASRIPLLARLPGTMPAGHRCEEVASLVDIAPSCCQLAGAAIDGYEGLPMQEVAAHRHQRPYVFSQHSTGDSAQYLAVSRTHSFFYSAADDREYCYDQMGDPRQQHLIPTASPFHQHAVAQLRQTLQDFLRRRGPCEALDAQTPLGWRHYPSRQMSPNPDDGLLVQDHWWAIPRSIIPGYTDRQQFINVLGDTFDSFCEEFPEQAALLDGMDEPPLK